MKFARTVVPSPPDSAMWKEPFTDEDYLCGKEPNAFLVSIVTMLEPGKTLCLAEGEGRNAVFLASYGFTVLAADDSAMALAKTEQLAIERGVSVETRLVDWAEFDPGVEQFDNIISVFCHLPPDLRRRLHANVVRALRPGGMFVLEAFRREQLRFKSGGPTEVSLLMSMEEIYQELKGLDWVRVAQVERNLHEGRGHQGRGAMLEIVARKRYVHRPQGTLH